jgi:hypothetical protein
VAILDARGSRPDSDSSHQLRNGLAPWMMTSHKAFEELVIDL